MSASSKMNLKIKKPIKRGDSLLSNIEKRDSSLDKAKHSLNLKNTFYQKESKQDMDINNNLSILNFVINKDDRRSSLVTNITYKAPEKLDYDLDMVNKYDEDRSLSFISEFDLEEDDSKQGDESFSSCENDDPSIEEVEIIKKYPAHKRVSCDYIYKKPETDLDLEKDWNEIRHLLLKKQMA